MGTSCKGSLFLLLLAFAACGCGKAQPSCNSVPGSMSCRALSDVDAGATIHTEAVNIKVPSLIEVPSGSKLIGVLRAVGHQHYRYNGTEWVLYNATAWLYEGEEGANMTLSGAVKGTHFYLVEADSSGGRPSWRLGTSRVTAKSAIAVSVDSDSITWNLLQATSYQLIVSGDGEGEAVSTSWAKVVGDVSFVQRLDTQRGLPPAASHPHTHGDTFASVYSALYAFYSSNS